MSDGVGARVAIQMRVLRATDADRVEDDQEGAGHDLAVTLRIMAGDDTTQVFSM